MDLSLIALGALAGGIANRYAGWEHGDRYVPAAFLTVALLLAFGFKASLLGILFLLWRSVGWHKSIDIGRNEGSATRDFVTLIAISILPAVAAALVFGTLVALWLAVIPSLVYTAVMWGLPWHPKFRHIAVAEWITGAALGAVSVVIVTA
jgi:hypothetical protein